MGIYTTPTTTAAAITISVNPTFRYSHISNHVVPKRPNLRQEEDGYCRSPLQGKYARRLEQNATQHARPIFSRGRGGTAGGNIGSTLSSCGERGKERERKTLEEQKQKQKQNGHLLTTIFLFFLGWLWSHQGQRPTFVSCPARDYAIQGSYERIKHPSFLHLDTLQRKNIGTGTNRTYIIHTHIHTHAPCAYGLAHTGSHTK